MTMTLAIRDGAADTLRDSAGAVTDSDLAAYMRLSPSLVSRVLGGKSAPGSKFIASVLLTFPTKFEDVFQAVAVEDKAA